MKHSSQILTPYSLATCYTRGTLIIKRFNTTVEELLTRRRPQRLEQYALYMLNTVESYIMTPPNHTYITFNSKREPLVALFLQGLVDVYRDKGKGLAHSIRADIGNYL